MHQKIDILEKAIAKILNSSVVSLKSLGGGRNSRVYRVRCSNGQLYVAKLYFRHKADLRDRLNVEFSSLQFLWKEGVRCIPQPLLAEPEHGYAIYEYIEGQTILPKQITEADIHETVHFLNTLKELRHVREAQRLPLASEACFSIQAVFENIQRRLERLNVLQGSGEHYEALRQFLTDDFVPAFHELTTWAKAKLEAFHMSYSKELEVCERTLSPSDFGFHNAIKRSHGEEKRQYHKIAPIVFLDFEYFGWDDPAKMIADFLLHPAMELHEGLKQEFMTQILRCFREYRHLAQRVEVVFPLFGLKWCMILLNEFVQEDLLRRGFVQGDLLNESVAANIQCKQLRKARHMLSAVMNEYQDFP